MIKLLSQINCRYEMFKTEDLPKLTKASTFDEGTVLNVARNILAFLHTKATKEGHTYWLFKAKDEDIVKLYDLTSLSDQNVIIEDDTEDNRNPFKDAVALLLYKMARNIVHKKRTQDVKLKYDKSAKNEKGGNKGKTYQFILFRN